ncbi:MAG: polymerase [Treponema sp.]|nr:polymerase [Treponema sp.]
MKKVLIFLVLITLFVSSLFPQNIGITGTVRWDTLQLNAEITLDLSSAGLRLPAGRTQGESILSAGYTNLIRSSLMGLRVDSSSTIADLIERGEFSLLEVEALAAGANKTAPSLSNDMRGMSSSYMISLLNISSALISHIRPAPVARVLNPVSTQRYTGIIIIAYGDLPVYGMRGTSSAVPCLFPKIWDSEMNLIYDKSMLDSRYTAMARYSSSENIFKNDHPSGLSADLREVVGERPLRIFAQGVFGINPTDLIINRIDALQIISTSENRGLLSQGKVAIILNESALSYDF